MKTLIAPLAFASVAHADPGFDGCFQLYVPGAMYPAFCLQGTTEEGIGGSGARLAIFATNTDRLVYCSKSTASAMTADSYLFELNGKKEMILENVKDVSGRKEGDAIFGSTRLKFMEIDAGNTLRLLGIANKRNDCQ